MALSHKHLAEGETVVMSLRTHYKVLLRPAIVLVLLVAVVLALNWVIPGSDQGGWILLGLVVLAAIAALVWVVVPFLRWLTTSYTITTRRIVTRSGLVTRVGRDIPLYRINDVASEKGLLDRVLGCGTLVISDATEKAGMILDDVPDVEQVQVRLHDLLFSADDGSDDGEWPPSEPPRGPRGPTGPRGARY